MLLHHEGSLLPEQGYLPYANDKSAPLLKIQLLTRKVQQQSERQFDASSFPAPLKDRYEFPLRTEYPKEARPVAYLQRIPHYVSMN